jgi:hypothetical protein
MEVLDSGHGSQPLRSSYEDREERWICVLKSTNKLNRLINAVNVLEKWVGDSYRIFKCKDGASRLIHGDDGIPWDIFFGMCKMYKSLYFPSVSLEQAE